MESKDRMHTMSMNDTKGIEIKHEVKVIEFLNLDEDIINILVKENKETVDTNNISDGYHTFGELYEHRIMLYISLLKNISKEWLCRPDCASDDSKEIWKTKVHSDGSVWEGWFLLGIFKEPGKQITYHLPMDKWDLCDFAPEIEMAPTFDGHTSDDVLKRLLDRLNS